MESLDTQRKKILNYCKDHGSITIREAFTELNINSPSKRISEIRLSGLYDIDQIRMSKTNESGETVYFVRYYIKEKEVS